MKKDSKLIIVIMILGILLAGCVGFVVENIYYYKFNPKDNSSDIRKEEDAKLESRDLSQDELSILTSKIDKYNRNFSQYYSIDDMSKLSNADLFLFTINGVRKLF